MRGSFPMNVSYDRLSRRPSALSPTIRKIDFVWQTVCSVGEPVRPVCTLWSHSLEFSRIP